MAGMMRESGSCTSPISGRRKTGAIQTATMCSYPMAAWCWRRYRTGHFHLTLLWSTVLCLDHAQNGIGSNSCGPEVQEQYRFDEEEFVFQIQLVPYWDGE